jgi:hypothetical protein
MPSFTEISRTVVEGSAELFTSSLSTNAFTMPTNAVAGYVLTTDSNGIATWAVNSSSGAVADVVSVSINPGVGQFGSVSAAIATITDSSLTKPYVVTVGPGVYNEENITIPEYTCVWAHDQAVATIKAVSGTNPVFILADNSCVINITIDGNGNVGAGIDAATLDPTHVQILGCRLRDTTIGMTFGPSSNESYMDVKNLTVLNPSVSAWVIDGTGAETTHVHVADLECRGGGAGPSTAIRALGSNSELTIQTARIEGTGSDTAISVENSGVLFLQGAALTSWATGVITLADGGTPSVRIESTNFSSVTTELDFVNTSTTGFLFSEFNDLNNFNIPQTSSFYIYGEPGETVIVAKKGGDFTTLGAAIAYVNAQTPSLITPWSINIASGTFTETNPITVGPFIQINGSSPELTRLVPSDPNQDMFIATGHASEFHNMTIIGNTGAAGIKFEGASFSGLPLLITDMFFQNCRQCIDISNTNGPVVCSMESLKVPIQLLSQRHFVRVTQTNSDSANFIETLMIQCVNELFVTPTVSDPFTSVEYIGFTGANPSNLVLRDLIIFQKGLSETTGMRLENVNAQISGYDADFCASAITIPNSTLPTTLNVTSFVARSCTKDVIILSNTAAGSIQGIADPSKVDEASAPSHSINFLLQNSALGGIDITGEFSIGTRLSTRTDLLPAIQGDVTIGLYTGGVLSATGGLNISVASGTGYITSGSSSDPLVYVTWDSPLTSSIPTNSDRYVSVVSGGSLQLTSALPNTYTAILIGRVKTNGSTVLFIENISAEGLHSSTLIDRTFREAFGAVVSGGMIASAGTSNYQISVTSGNYYYSTHKYSPSGGTDVTFTQFYRVAGVWTNALPANSLSAGDARRYDDGSDLVALVATQFAKHVIYVVNDGSDETYVFIYGQETFATQNDAENGGLPAPPSFMDAAFCPVAALVVSDTSTNWVVVQDVRPTLAFRSSGVTATSDHGSLAGLLDDDHTQYLLVNGSRAFAGTLDLGTNNITNAGTINGITITSLASRLQPGGADPLSASTAPSTIGTSNVLGVSNDLARADHIHAHGVQTDGTLHAVATGSVAGFMSAADKTTFDAATPLSTASTLVSRDGSGATAVDQLTVDSNGAVRLANTANTFHTSIVAPSGLGVNYTLTLPPNDGDANQVLQTNGSGVTSWTNPQIAGTVYYTATGPSAPISGDWRTIDDAGVLKTQRYNGSSWVDMMSLTPP